MAKTASRPAAESSPPHIEDGDRAESLAAGYFLEKGYTVLQRNYRPKVGNGEVDLIVEKGPVLAFVEVRYRRTHVFGFPEETVTREKRRKVVLAAADYVARNREHNRAIRFDVISIRDSRQGARLEHYPDAFEAHLRSGDYSLFL